MSRSTILLSAALLVASSVFAHAQRSSETDLPRAATKTWPDAGTPAANERSEREREKAQAETTGVGDRSQTPSKQDRKNR